MDLSSLFTCRGCASEVGSDPVSLVDPCVKDLYEKCTNLSIPDLNRAAGPTQLCQECHNKCKEWLSFKTICSENERIFSSQDIGSSKDPLEPSDSLYVDGSWEEMVLQVEEDEEDLLAVFSNTSQDILTKKNSTDSDLSPRTVQDPYQSSFANVLQSQKDNSQDSIELRLSKLMEISMDTSQDDNTGVISPIIVPNNSITDQLKYQSTDGIESPTVNNVDCLDDNINLKHTLINEQNQHISEKNNVVESTDTEQKLATIEEVSNNEVTSTLEIISEDYLDDLLCHSEAPRDRPQLPLAENHKHRNHKRKTAHYTLSSAKSKKVSSADMKSTRTDASNIWKCPLCVTVLSCRRDVEEHLKREPHVLKDSGKCPLCPRFVDPPRSLLTHIYNRHIGDYHCTLCFASFATKGDFTEHRLKNHFWDEARKFHGCPLCDKPCTLGGLFWHIQKRHLKEKSLECPACPARYENTQSVVGHIASYHASKWRCTICLKRCYSAHVFGFHENMHKKKEREEEERVNLKNHELLRLVRELRNDVK